MADIDNENSIMNLFNQFSSWLGQNSSSPRPSVSKQISDSIDFREFSNNDFLQSDFDMPGDPTMPTLDANSWMQNMGQWGNAAKGAAALGGAYNNFQQIKLGKKQLEKDNKFRDMNYANTVTTTNSQVADQWGAKFARAGGEGTAGAQRLGSLEDYMKNRGVS